MSVYLGRGSPRSDLRSGSHQRLATKRDRFTSKVLKDCVLCTRQHSISELELRKGEAKSITHIDISVELGQNPNRPLERGVPRLLNLLSRHSEPARSDLSLAQSLVLSPQRQSLVLVRLESLREIEIIGTWYEVKYVGLNDGLRAKDETGLRILLNRLQ